MEGTEKLLLIDVTIGEKKTRKLVAGIAQTHDIDQLIGKQIVVISNLEQKEIRGHRSEGMLLAADINGTPVLLTPEKEVPDGSNVR